jgi:phosphate uptake regulator
MKRRVIKQGHNTLTVTLPSDWVKNMNLKAGDELNICENGKSLTITGEQATQSRSITIKIDELSRSILWRFFQSAYREGFNEIRFEYDERKRYSDPYTFFVSQFDNNIIGEPRSKKHAIDMIQAMVNRFIGLEIISHGKGYCIVHEMGEFSDKEYDNAVKRIFLLTEDFLNKIILTMKENKAPDMALCNTYYSIDRGIDKFVDYCCKINNRLGNTKSRSRQVMFATLYLFELLGDEIKYMGTDILVAKKPIKEMLPAVEATLEHFKLYKDMFFDFDTEKAIKFGKNDYWLFSECLKSKKTRNSDTESIRKRLMQIGKYTLSLAELRIELEYTKE